MTEEPEDSKDIVRSKVELDRQEQAEIDYQATYYQRSGPLPDADQMALYEKIVPGSAAKLFQMAEKEQEHRHSLDQRDSKIQERIALEEINLSQRGQWMAYSLNILGFGAGFFLIATGNAGGAGIVITTILANAGVFLGEKLSQRFLPKPSKEDPED